MTDNEIIKALNESICPNGVSVYLVDKKSNSTILTLADIIDLINRLQADCENYKQVAEHQQSVTMGRGFEIKRLTEKVNKLQTENENYSKNNGQMTSDILKMFKELEQAKAENERLKVERDKEHDYSNHYARMCVKAKAEAYKEFAEKAIELIKTKAFNLSLMRSLYTDQSSKALYRCAEDIDNLLKELVGDSK